MELNCLIVDDEPLALDLMESYVKRTPFLKLVARCSNALEVLQVLREEAVGLCFFYTSDAADGEDSGEFGCRRVT